MREFPNHALNKIDQRRVFPYLDKNRKRRTSGQGSCHVYYKFLHENGESVCIFVPEEQSG